MKNDTVRLDNLRIASPCPVGWEQMTGDERVRRCDLCELHVYDISRMTRREAESLIASSEGRICARLFRRADGTIITRDCPVGLRAIKRRVAKTAGALFAAIMTLCATVAGQNPSGKDKTSCSPRIKITSQISNSAAQAGTIVLKILDVNGAVVAGADITISESVVKPGVANTKNRSWQLTSDDEGRIELPGLAKGNYDLKIEQPGFMTFILNEVRLGVKEVITVEITLTVSQGTATVGLLDLGPSLIDTPPGTTIINRKMIESLPHPK